MAESYNDIFPYKKDVSVIIMPFMSGINIDGVYMDQDMMRFIGDAVKIKNCLGNTFKGKPYYKIEGNHWSWPHSVLKPFYQSKEQLMKDVVNLNISIKQADEFKKKLGGEKK